MQPPRTHPACTAGATSSSIHALLFQTRPWAGHGGMPTREPFPAGVCMHAGTLRPRSRRRTGGGMSLLSPHVLHTQPQPAFLPGDARGMAGGMETTWRDAAGCSTSIDPRPSSKQTGSWDFLPSLGQRTSKLTTTYCKTSPCSNLPGSLFSEQRETQPISFIYFAGPLVQNRSLRSTVHTVSATWSCCL